MSPNKYELRIAPTARKQLAEHLPESVAWLAFESISSTLLVNPQRLGKRLLPLADGRRSALRGTYRVIYTIDEPKK